MVTIEARASFKENMPQWLINKELNDMPTVQFLKMGFMVKVATTSIVII